MQFHPCNPWEAGMQWVVTPGALYRSFEVAAAAIARVSSVPESLHDMCTVGLLDTHPLSGPQAIWLAGSRAVPLSGLLVSRSLASHSRLPGRLTRDNGIPEIAISGKITIFDFQIFFVKIIFFFVFSLRGSPEKPYALRGTKKTRLFIGQKLTSLYKK